MKFAHYLHRLFVIGKCTTFYGGDFCCEDFPWRGKYPGDKLSRRYFTLKKFAKILIRNYFYLSYLLFADPILHVEMLRGIARGKLLPG